MGSLFLEQNLVLLQCIRIEICRAIRLHQVGRELFVDLAEPESRCRRDFRNAVVRGAVYA